MVKKIIKNILFKRGFVIKPYVAYYENIEKVRYNWLQKIKFDLILDVGASDGGFVKKIRTVMPLIPIYSFEPISESYQKLIEKNMDDENFTAFNIALSSKEGESDFYISSSSGCSSLLEMSDIHKEAYPHTASLSKIKVPMKRLDDVMKEYDYKNIFLKIDVQGAEKFVLDGAIETLQNVDVILIEVNFVETYKECVLINEIIAYLEGKGFVLNGMENISQSTLDGSFLQADAFFIKK